VVLIPLGLWVVFDGLRYETLLGRVVLPGIGTVLAVIGVALIIFAPVNDAIQGVFWFLAKVFTFLFIYVWMRGTLPRFRYDQLMSFGWKFLLPVSIANVVLTSAVVLWRMH
jgi:NADH:ubiquinone oxidoreductase subunit H